MKTNPLDIFSLHYENKDSNTVITGIENGISFRGKLRRQLPKYGLQDASLEIRQGFAYLSEEKGAAPDPTLLQLTAALEEKQRQTDSLHQQQRLSADVFSEMKIQYPFILSVIIDPVSERTDSAARSGYLVWLSLKRRFSGDEKRPLEAWLKLRLHQENLKLITQP
jgi:hypothetical protein